jgi:hypothetical protein
MGRAFTGPFRASGIDDLTVGRDGEIFLTFRDKDNNVLGVIADHSTLAELFRRFQCASREVEPAPIGRKLKNPSIRSLLRACTR